MRIWIVNQYAYTPSQSAGTRHWALAKRLRQQGHEVTIIATSFFHKACRETRLEDGELYRREMVEGVPYLWLRTPPYKGNTSARLWNMAVFAQRVLRETGMDGEPRPDLIYGSSPSPFAAWAAMKLAQRFDVPFVLEIRDLWPETLFCLKAIKRRGVLAAAFRKLERTLYRGASQIVTLLPDAAPYLVERGARPEAIHWIPNGLDLQICPRPTPLQRSDEFTAMYAGSLGRANGIDVLVDAAKHLQSMPHSPKIRLRLIGDGREKARLQDRVSREDIYNVDFQAPTSKKQVYSLLQSADAFLMHQHDSPLVQWGISPNKLPDYFACARPVIYSIRTRFNPVAEAEAGVSAEPTSQAIANAIFRVSQAPLAERVAMGNRAREYAERVYDFDVLAHRLHEILCRASGTAPSRSGIKTAA